MTESAEDAIRAYHDRLCHDSRWSGVVERIDDEWPFATMHASAPLE